MVKATYTCEKCSEEYLTLAEARKCEKRLVPPSLNLPISLTFNSRFGEENLYLITKELSSSSSNERRHYWYYRGFIWHREAYPDENWSEEANAMIDLSKGSITSLHVSNREIVELIEILKEEDLKKTAAFDKGLRLKLFGRQ